MRVVVTGASGNIGTALLRRLTVEPGIDEVTGIARRAPDAAEPYDRVRWETIELGADGVTDRLTDVFDGADGVVHLAWQILAGRDRQEQVRTNHGGSAQVFTAAARARVPGLLFLSSAAVYTPCYSRHKRVDENWPRRGIPSSAYSRDKVAVEDLLDTLAAELPELRVVRVRPPAVLQHNAASQIARTVLGRLAPLARLTRARVPVLFLPNDATTQVVHADDVADLITRAIFTRATGPFNVADEPVLTPAAIARLLGGRHVPVPGPAVRVFLGATQWLRLQPLDASWLDLLVNSPLLDVGRARTELGWRPRHHADTTVTALRRGISGAAGAPSPPLQSPTSKRR